MSLPDILKLWLFFIAYGHYPVASGMEAAARWRVQGGRNTTREQDSSLLPPLYMGDGG